MESTKMKLFQPRALKKASGWHPILTAAVSFFLLFTIWSQHTNRTLEAISISAGRHFTPAKDPYFLSVQQTGKYLRKYPLDSFNFGQMGERLQILKGWIELLETAQFSRTERDAWSREVERSAISLMPFIRHPQQQQNTPVARLRESFVPGSRGIVITVSGKQFRQACHLVTNLRQVLNSKLPIQIAYAGEEELPKAHREFITGLGPDITTFDVASIFEEGHLGVLREVWAVKPFAALGSTFEQLILMDTDMIFLQNPDQIFADQHRHAEAGVKTFHDRLTWKSRGVYKERSNTGEEDPIVAHERARVFAQKYGREGDAGLVVVNKSRLDVLIGLLHVCWQNTKPVRNFTYHFCHGDKESWWLGLELTGTPYSIEEHYGAVVGRNRDGAKTAEDGQICSHMMAHTDQRGNLFWYSGGALEHKAGVRTDMPTEWMMDGTWERRGDKLDMGCMEGSIMAIDDDLAQNLQKLVVAVNELDEKLGAQLPEADL